MNKRILSLLAAAILVGCTPEEKAPAQTITEIQAEKGIPVRTAKAMVGDLVHTEKAGGTIKGIHQTYIANGVAGTLNTIKPKVGAKVKKGATVATMRFDNGTPIATAQAAYDFAKASYDRVEKLFNEGAIPKAQLEEVKIHLEKAKYDLRGARLTNSIKAPFSGTIIEVLQSVGSNIKEKTPILQIADLNEILIDMQIHELSADKYKVGQKALLYTDSDTLIGTIERKTLSASAMTHGFTVTARFDNREAKLSPGIYKQVEVVVDKREAVTMLPIEHIRYDNNGAYIFKVTDNSVAKTALTLGLKNSTYIEVIAGISAEEAYVSEGATMISDGTKVNVVNSGE